MRFFKKLWSRVLAGIAAILPMMITGKVFASSSMQDLYGVSPADMPMLYGVYPVAPQLTFWEIALRILGYIIIPVAVIVLIIVGIIRSRKKRKK